MRRELMLTFDQFGWESLEAEARRDGETVALLYLADIDSGRVANRVLDRAEVTGGDVP